MSRRPPYENETQARDARLDRPPGRLRYKARGHVTMHAATGEVQVTPREMRQMRIIGGPPQPLFVALVRCWALLECSLHGDVCARRRVVRSSR